MPWKPRVLSISSGGIKICAELGVLAELAEAGMLDNVQEWHGCSAGAICSVIGALGASPAWMRTLVETLQVSSFTAPQYECIENYMNCWGINDGAGMVEYFKRIIETWEPGFHTWTFADFAAARPGVSLTIIATNISRQCLARFNAELTPTMRILDALRASGSIPMYFTPWIDSSGEYFCDGAATEYYPWSYLTDKENTLVIACDTASVRPATAEHPRSLQEYLRNLARCIRHDKKPAPLPRHWIGLGLAEIDGFAFGMPKEQRVELFEGGRAAARGFLTWSRHLIDSGRATAQTPGRSDCQRTLSSDPPSPDTGSGSPECRSPPLPACPSQGSRSASLRASRRWSL